MGRFGIIGTNSEDTSYDAMASDRPITIITV